MTLEKAYMLLGATKDDSDIEVKKKYHKLMMEYHPDRHSGEDVELATRKTQEINLAYEAIIDSRNGKSKDFDWGIQIKVTYKRPPRPKGRINQNANIVRSTFGHHCDYWNLWKPSEEDEFTFLGSLYPDINRKIQQYRSEHDFLFSDPIIDRITYFGAAEYIDPYSSLCKIYSTSDLCESVFFTVTTRNQDIQMEVNSPIKIVFDQSVFGQPYAVLFQLSDGTIIGTIRTLKSICISLLKSQFGAMISGNIASISNGSEYDHSTRKHISVRRIRIKLHIGLEIKATSLWGYVNNGLPINELLGYYAACSSYLKNYYEKHTFTEKDTLWIYQSILNKVQKAVVTCTPIYTLDYRVYEGDARSIDGKAQCHDLGKISLLNQEEKEVFLNIIGASRMYAPLRKFCNSNPKYYRFDGKNVFIVIRLHTQKNPNCGYNHPDYWHRIQIQIFPNEV